MSSTDETRNVLADIKEMLAEQISVGETTNRLLNELNTSIDVVLGVSIVPGATSLADVASALEDLRGSVLNVGVAIETLGDS